MAKEVLDMLFRLKQKTCTREDLPRILSTYRFYPLLWLLEINRLTVGLDYFTMLKLILWLKSTEARQTIAIVIRFAQIRVSCSLVTQRDTWLNFCSKEVVDFCIGFDGKIRVVSGLVVNFMNTSCTNCYLDSSRIMKNRLKLHVIYTLERFVHSRKTHSPCRFCEQLGLKVFLGY